MHENELYLAYWKLFSRRILQRPPKADNSSTCLSFPVFHVVLQLYFDEVFFFVCNLLRTALDL